MNVNLRDREPRNQRGGVLPPHLIEMLDGSVPEPAHHENFHPLLKKRKENLENRKCPSCLSKCELLFGRLGSLKCCCVSREECDYKDFCCPVCGRNFKKQQTVVSHYEKQHQERNCPFCNQLLPLATSDRLSHISAHYSKRILDSVGGDFDENDEEDPFDVSQTPLNRFQVLDNDPDPIPIPMEYNISQGQDPPSNPIIPLGVDDYIGDEITIPDGGSISDPQSPRIDRVVDEDEDEGEEENEEYLCERWKDHISSLQKEFEFCFSNNDHFDGLTIKPLEPNENGDWGLFLEKHNLRLIKYARKAHLSGALLQELIDDMNDVYDSPKVFYAAETLIKKLHQCGGYGGLQYKEFQCPINHKVCIIPIEEGLKLLFSKDEFLMDFHVKEWEIGDNEPYVHFRQSEKFIGECRRVRNRYRSHYISILANRDAFPAYLTSHLPIKGYYYCLGNNDYPTIERFVVVYAFGMECKGCIRVVEEKFVENVNRLSTRPFRIFHRFLGKWVQFVTELDAEIDDTPQVSENLMTKGATANLFCSQCGQHKDHVNDPFTYNLCKSKTLCETEELYRTCQDIMVNSRRGDGSITRVKAIEDRTGRTFFTDEYSSELGTNVSVLKPPTTFFKLNEYTKKSIINPPGPFHSVVKGFILHCKDGVEEKLTREQRRIISQRWKQLDFPKGIKKPENLWQIGGSNFDAILSVIYGFSSVLTTVVPADLSKNIRKCFRSLACLLTPGYSKETLKSRKKDYFESVPEISRFIDLKFPTVHQTFHVWDRVVPGSFNNPRFSNPTPAPPRGPLLGRKEPVIGLGPVRNWSEKKFEVKHRYFKKKMRRCFLRNPSVFLIKEYIADEHLSVKYPENKWSWFSPSVQYTRMKEAVISLREKKQLAFFLEIGAWGVENVGFFEIRCLRVGSKTYRRGYKIVCASRVGSVSRMFHVSWNGGVGLEESEILLVFKALGSERETIFRVSDVQGKPVLKGMGLTNVIP